VTEAKTVSYNQHKLFQKKNLKLNKIKEGRGKKWYTHKTDTEVIH
jgi:hypothetical protein